MARRRFSARLRRSARRHESEELLHDRIGRHRGRVLYSGAAQGRAGDADAHTGADDVSARSLQQTNERKTVCADASWLPCRRLRRAGHRAQAALGSRRVHLVATRNPATLRYRRPNPARLGAGLARTSQ